MNTLFSSTYLQVSSTEIAATIYWRQWKKQHGGKPVGEMQITYR